MKTSYGERGWSRPAVVIAIAASIAAVLVVMELVSGSSAEPDGPLPGTEDTGPSQSGPPPTLPGFVLDQAWQDSIGAHVDRSTGDVELYVDASHQNASDANPGTADSPLATIGAALDMAQDHRGSGLGVRVVVGPGTYREALEIVGPNLPGPDPLLLLEAAEPGTVTVSGSDVWTAWEPSGDGSWVADWPHDWGLAPIPNGWDNVEVTDYVRRREMVFIDRVPLIQVESAADLEPGTFLVDEQADRITLRPDGTDPSSGVVEVAVRQEVLRILLTDHVVIDGLSFTHANPALGNAVSVLESDDVVLDSVAVDWNNWGGLQIFDSSRVTVTSSSASHNGGRGVGMADVEFILVESVATSDNNWRGRRGGFTGWSVAGVKVHHLHDAIFRNVVSRDNETRGFWLDTDNVRVLVDGAEWCGNLRDGVFVEATQGPVVIRASRICQNGDHGVLSANVVGLGLVDSTVCGNGLAQVEISGLPAREIDLHYATGSLSVPGAEDWLITGTEISSSGGSDTLVGTTFGSSLIERFASGLQADDNRWRSGSAEAFELREDAGASFAEWQRLTGEGTGSTFGPPAEPSGCAP